MKQFKIFIFIVILLSLVSLTDARECFQETTNASSSSDSAWCGSLLNFSGNYTDAGGFDNWTILFDENYDTFDDANPVGNIFAIYQSPDNIINNTPYRLDNITWRVKDESGETNLTLPEACTNWSYIYLQMFSGSNVQWLCYKSNLLSINLLTVPAIGDIYEEGIYWGLGELLVENNQTFNSSTFESNNEDFIINISYDNINFGISAILVYNNTNYTGTQSGSGSTVLFSRTITVPSITAQENKTFYWLIGLINATDTYWYNSTSNNQTIKTFEIDDCSVHTNVIMNISLLDETTRNFVDTNGSNIEIEINYGDISYFNNFTNRNNLSICMNNLSFGNIINTTIKYSSTNRVVEYYYIDNHILVSGDVPFILDLYNLNSSKSTSYLNTYKNCFFLLVDNAIIEVWRKYVGNGTFYLVEMARTNEVGQAVTHLVSEDVIYYYKVRKDGELEYITPEFNALCIDTPCQVNINQKGIYCDEETFDPYQSDTSILYDFLYNSTTRTLTFDYSTVDGSTATLNLTVKLFNQYLNSTTCSEQVTSAGGTLTCVLLTTLLNSTYYAEVTKNEAYLDHKYIDLNANPMEIFGLDGVLMTALLILTLSLMFIPTGWGIPVVAVLGFITASIISLISFNYTLIIWLSIASLVIVLKIAKKSGSG